MDLTTRGGQELAAAIKTIARTLNSNYEDVVAQRAWELFKQEAATCELIPPFGETEITEVRLKHYAEHCFRVAKVFTDIEGGK